METEPTFGIDENGDGWVVGLWFAPARVDVDVNAYVKMTADELAGLAHQILDRLTRGDEV